MNTLANIVISGLILAATSLSGLADEGTVKGSDLESLWRATQEGLKQVDDFVTEVTALPDSIEMKIGNQIAGRLNSDFEFAEDWRAQQLRKLGERLAPFAKRKGIKYKFNLVDSDTINAYSVAGGHIWVTTSMFDLVGSDEDELAGILGHEIAHIDSRHCIRTIQYQILATGIDPEYADYARIGYGAYQRGYSQLNELEADRLGAQVVHDAGLSPWGLVQVMTKFSSLEPNQEDLGDPDSVADAIALAQHFLKTHPASEERREKLTKFIRGTLDDETGR